ncbi:hypothetical protein DIPPA_58989 [Diplonema papillatum]|nr:hypothetical protein DIPPA_58989 [Diplonema papillatum]
MRFEGIMLCTLCLTASTCETEMRWVLFKVHRELGVSVVRERLISTAPASHVREKHRKHLNTTIFTVHHAKSQVKQFEDEAPTAAVHFSEPSAMVHEHWDDIRMDINGTTVKSDVTYAPFVLPMSVVDIHIVEHSSPAWSVLGPRNRKTHRFARGAATLSDPSFSFEPQLTTVQKVGPVGDTFNLVFLAGCYTQRSDFDADVQRAVRFLSGTVTAEESITLNNVPLHAQPWNRYWTYINVFSVWDESPQDGANHPDPRGSIANPKPNRLQCSYGTTIKRMLACNYAETAALASYAPAADLIITIVNDDEYGGAGGGGQAYLYNGKNFEKVLIHETGHASGGLSDEYDYGFDEESALSLINCAKKDTEVPWSDWFPTWQGLGKPSSTFETCSYSNFVRPNKGEKGDQSCLMRSSGMPKLCDVCREGLLQNALYENLKDLSLPRCPVASETLVMAPADVSRLHINPAIQDFYWFTTKSSLWGPAFNVSWSCVNGPAGTSAGPIKSGTSDTTELTVGACPSGGEPGAEACGWPGGAQAVEGDYLIRAEIADTVRSHNWLLSTAMRTSADFRVRITQGSEDLSACVRYDCNTRYGRGTDNDCLATNEVACLTSKCYWDKTLGSCRRFFGKTNEHGRGGYSICTLCDGDPNECNMSYTTNPQKAEVFIPEGTDTFDSNPVNVDQVSEQLGGGAVALFIGLAGILLGMIVMLYKTCSKTLNHSELEGKYTQCNSAVRLAIMVLFALMVWGSVAVAGFAVFLFLQAEMEIWGHMIILVTGLAAGGVLIVSFFIFSAAAARGKCQLGVSVVLLVLTTILLMVMAVIVHQMANSAAATVEAADNTPNAESWEAININVGDFVVDLEWMETLGDLWKTACRKKPDLVCQFQAEVHCSGFQKACFNVQNSYCPKNCTVGNSYVNPCMSALQRKLATNFRYVSVISILLAAVSSVGLLLVAYLFVSMFCCAEQSYNNMKNEKSFQPSMKRHPSSAMPPMQSSLQQPLTPSDTSVPMTTFGSHQRGVL